MEFFKIRRTIPFMRHALVFNVISLVTFLAAVFFLSLAYFCLRLFPHDGEQPPGTGIVYRVCGVVILACLVLIALVKYLGLIPGLHPALWLEAVAVEAFGVAWGVKGGTLKPKSVP